MPGRRRRRLNYYNDIDPFCCEWLRSLVAAGEIPKGCVDDRSIADVRPEDLREFTQCHFFAGVGGWPLALRIAGWPADEPVWTGSCPCQPFSAAGKRRGARDERHLWPEFFRLIREGRPPALYGEQVATSEVVGSQQEAAFLVAVQDGDYARANKLAKRLAQSKSFHWPARWIDGVQADLASAGYAFGFTVLGAHSVGAPHIRQRVYWMAKSDCRGRGPRRAACEGQFGKSTLIRTSSDGGLVQSDGTGPQPGRATAETAGHRCAAEPASWSDFVLVGCADGKCRRVSAQSGDEPLAHGLPRKLVPELAGLRGLVKDARRNRVGRLRGYGNAIVPQVAAEVIRAYLERPRRAEQRTQ